MILGRGLGESRGLLLFGMLFGWRTGDWLSCGYLLVQAVQRVSCLKR
jgi:hypothetical protein